MAMRKKKLVKDQRAMYEGARCTVLKPGPTNTEIRNQYGFVETVKTKDLTDAD